MLSLKTALPVNFRKNDKAIAKRLQRDERDSSVCLHREKRMFEHLVEERHSNGAQD
jgi:hypothetical protein